MMTKTSKKWLTGVSLLACHLSLSTILVSCGDFLEAENKAAIEADAYFGTEQGLNALRAVMYDGMKSIATNTSLTEYGTDLYVPSRGTSAGAMGLYTIVPENGDVTSFYQNAYSMINNANCMLKYGSSNPKYVAEAKFIRAYGYYMLTQQFGAVPYVVDYIETARKDYPRTSLTEVYQSVVAELESIAGDSNLPETDHQGAVSQRAVKALLAKVCLMSCRD